MELDVDTLAPKQPEPPSDRPSRKGRRNRAAVIDAEDMVDSRPTTQGLGAISKNSEMDINTEIPKDAAKSGWDTEESRKGRKSRKSVTDIEDRKATVVGGEPDDGIVIIPDLMYLNLIQGRARERNPNDDRNSSCHSPLKPVNY
jgi:hypothetical protein